MFAIRAGVFWLFTFGLCSVHGHSPPETAPAPHPEPNPVSAWELVTVSWSMPRRLSGEAPTAVPEELDVAFAPAGKRVRLRLRRNRVLMPRDVRHVLHFPDGHTEEGPLPNANFYQGEMLDGTPGRAGFSLSSAGLSGLVLPSDGDAVIQLAPVEWERKGLLTAAGTAQHQVRHVEDAQLKDFVGDVGTFMLINETNISKGRSLSQSGTKYVEVVVVNDQSRYSDFGGNSGLPALATHSASVMNTVNTIYRTPPSNNAQFPFTIQVVLVAQHTFVFGDPWETTVKRQGSETDCSSLLDLFNSWSQAQQSVGGLPAADNRVLLSGRNFDGSTVGLAGVSTMCFAARTGNVNMCGATTNSIASCAATVAHEMGHNFGMRHDSGGDCPQSGWIMEAVGGGDASTTFSSCSAQNIANFFSKSYVGNGECLENMPTTVFGDPICQNGFVESGEDCDCGSADCSSRDPCCDGQTCHFLQNTYECSDATGPCCQNCMFVSAAANKVCRAEKNTCDVAEKCAGGTASCPNNVFIYPGTSCSFSSGGKSYEGLCSSGKCNNLDYTCTVEITRDFSGSWDLSDTCAAFNNDCSTLVCHNAEESQAWKCGQSFSTHGKQMPVPEGTPCWFPGDPLGTHLGMCSLGACTLPHILAVVPFCGNGGIDFGEQCDCGNAKADPCCDCTICRLKAGKQCSSQDACCDSNCALKSAGAVCRPATGECDVAETCTGSSAICPSDVGVRFGTTCTAEDGVVSTCYGKVCIMSLDAQCASVTANEKTKAEMDLAGVRRLGSQHQCEALMCCLECKMRSGDYLVNGERTTNPWICGNCEKRTASSSFTVNGVTTTLQLGGATDGTMLADTSEVCISGATSPAMSLAASCSAGQFLDASVGRCLSCDAACTTCTGPSNFDCSGSCKFGTKDTRGACAISAQQATFGPTGDAATVTITVATTTDAAAADAAGTTMLMTTSTDAKVIPTTTATTIAGAAGTTMLMTTSTDAKVIPTTGAAVECSLKFDVSDTGFADKSCTKCRDVLRAAIATLAEVSILWVFILELLVLSRRLDAVQPVEFGALARRLASGSLKVDFEIRPPSSSVAEVVLKKLQTIEVTEVDKVLNKTIADHNLTYTAKTLGISAARVVENGDKTNIPTTTNGSVPGGPGGLANGSVFGGKLLLALVVVGMAGVF